MLLEGIRLPARLLSPESRAALAYSDYDCPWPPSPPAEKASTSDGAGNAEAGERADDSLRVYTLTLL
jgi:hypothetical protein